MSSTAGRAGLACGGAWGVPCLGMSGPIPFPEALWFYRHTQPLLLRNESIFSRVAPSGFLPRPYRHLAHDHFMVAQLSVCLPRSLSSRVSAPQGRDLTLFPAISPCWDECLAHSGRFSGQATQPCSSPLSRTSMSLSAAVSGHSAGTVLDLCLSPSLRPCNVTG